MTEQRKNLLAALTNIASELRTKSASDVADGGPTTHPVKSVDDGTTTFSEGERSRENEADIKQQIGGDNIEVAPGQGQDSDMLSKVQSTGGGLKPKPTGEDPEHERDYATTLKDPGTSMPAKVGEKYAALSYADNVKAATEIGNNILAAIAGPRKTAATAQTPAATLTAPTAKVASISTEDIVAATIRDAVMQADLLGEHLTRLKQAAEEEEVPPPAPGDPAGGTPAEGGQPPIAEADGLPPGGPMPGGEVPGAAPGQPPGADMGGGCATPGGDMPPAGMPPVGAEGGGNPEEAMQQLCMSLVEMGVTPEMLAAAQEQAQPDPSGGLPEKQAFVAGKCLDFMRAGKFRIEATKSARERELRDNSKAYLKQLFKI